jgi:hypothetical protein
MRPTFSNGFRLGTVFGVLLGFALGFVTSEAVAADRLTQHEVKQVVRSWDHTWRSAEPTKVLGVKWLKPRVARVHVKWHFGWLDITTEEGTESTPLWFPEWWTVKDRGPAGVWLWAPLIAEWEVVR